MTTSGILVPLDRMCACLYVCECVDVCVWGCVRKRVTMLPMTKKQKDALCCITNKGDGNPALMILVLLC
jgi:hypothetical protein